MSQVAEVMDELPLANHATFQVERIYRQPPAKVFRAFADKEMVRFVREMNDAGKQ